MNLTPVVPMPALSIQDETYQCFIEEAPEILLEIEQELFNLSASWDSQAAHHVMRLTHTLKGAASSTGLDTITQISHVLEDIFRALSKPGITMTPDVSAILFEGYECLRMSLMAELTGQAIDANVLIQQTTAVFKKVRDRFTEQFESDDLPTTEQMGFDIVQSIFESGVTERLEQLELAINRGHLETTAQTLKEIAKVFLELSTSLGLAGFGHIAQVTLTALEHYPTASLSIARIALSDFKAGRRAVANGDRTQGGKPSDVLCKMVAAVKTSKPTPSAPAPAQTTGKAPPQPISPVPPVSPTVASPAPLPSPQTTVTPSMAKPSAPSALSVSSAPQSASPLASASETAANVKIPQSAHHVDNSVSSLTTSPAATNPQTGSPAIVPVTNDAANDAAVHHLQLSPITSEDNSPATSGRPSVVRINVDHVNHLNSSLAEVLTVQNRQVLQDEHVQQSVHQLIQKMRQHQQQLNQLRDWSEQLIVRSEQKHLNRQNLSPELAKFDSLELDQYSEFQGVVQDVLEDAASLSEAIETVELLTRESSQTLMQQQRLLSNTQDALMDARMVPLSHIFNRLQPIVERLQARHQKQVNLTCAGSELLVDKAIAEQLYESMLHLVRNAFDHGIEALPLRQQRQKPVIGQIHISAQQQGNILFIKVQDDGNGLNFGTIRQQVVRQQLVTPLAAQRLSDQQLVDFLFKPGFSTAAQVSDISGRGVGLDVVAAQLNGINGAVAVTSRLSMGTQFTLKIPLQLTIVRILLCTVLGRTYGLLLNGIEQIITPRPEQLTTPATNNAHQVLHLGEGTDERLISVHALASLLPYDTTNPFPMRQTSTAAATSQPIILLNACEEEGSKTLLGIAVDDVIGEQELVLRPLHPIITPPPYVCGGSIMGNSQLALVLNGISLAQHALSRELAVAATQPPTTARVSSLPTPVTQVVPIAPQAFLSTTTPTVTSVDGSTPTTPSLPSAESPASTPPEQVPIRTHNRPYTGTVACTQILVIDDSITIRRNLARTLEKHGYSVIQAKDGLDAIDCLTKFSNIKLIFCDIEMPRMNGFEFIKHQKDNGVVKTTPIVVLTSRTGTKHRLLATEMGAAAYLNKPWLESILMKLVDDMLNR